MGHFKKQLGLFWVMNFLLLSFCPSIFAASQSEKSMLAMAQAAFEKDNTEEVRKLEPVALEESGGRASRMDDMLVLKLRNDNVRIYRNSPECRNIETETSCHKYTLVAYIPSANKFLVLLSTYEGAEYNLIDEGDGRETRFSVMPLFSPSQKYILLIYVNDNEFDFMLRIMRRREDKYVLDWQGKPGTSGGDYTDYKLLSWINDDEVCVKSKTRQTNNYRKVISKIYCMSHSPKGWKVDSLKNDVSR